MSPDFLSDLPPVTISEAELAVLQSPACVQPWGEHGFRLTPRTAGEVAQLLWLAAQQGQPLALSASEALAMEKPVWLDLVGLKAVRRHRVADFTLTVESGISMGELRALLEPHHQRFPLAYSDEMTLLAVLQEDRPALETVLAGCAIRGYPRDWVLGLEVATPDGRLTRCGGEVVKNVTGYDLAKLYIGQQPPLAVITAASLRLVALPETVRTWAFEFAALDEALASTERLMALEAPLTRCELFQEGLLSGAARSQSLAPWHLLVEMAGPSEWLKHAAAEVHAGVTMCVSETSLLPQLRDDRAGLLSRWPQGSLVLEVAVAPSDLPRLLIDFSRASLPAGLPAPIFQARPAAGLLWMVWPADTLPSEPRLADWCHTWLPNVSQGGGEARRLSPPPLGLGGRWDCLEAALCPEAHAQAAAWTAALRAAYDPGHILRG